MHIALFSPAWPLEKSQNGIVTYCHWMKRGLEGEGHRVSIICGGLDSSEPVKDVYLAKASRWDRMQQRWIDREGSTQHGPYAFARVLARTILRIHRSDPIDIIEMEESFGWCDYVRRLTNIPLVVKLHGPAFLSIVGAELETPEAREKIRREGDALRRSIAIVAPVSSTLDETLAYYQLSPKLSAHVVNPLTMGENTPVWRLADCDPNLLLFVGRFDSRKGADVVLRSFLLALKRHPQLKLIFVGPDRGLRLSDGSMVSFRQFLESFFPPQLRESVDYRGSMSNFAICELRTRAFLTIVASRWENPGYTLLEAMYQGCPVLCSDAGGCRETVQDGVTGRLARSESVADFAAKISEIVDNQGVAAQLGEAARRVVLNQYSIKRVAVESLNLYRRVLSH